MAKAADILHRLGSEIIKAMQKDINDFSGSLSKSLTVKVNSNILYTEMIITMLDYGEYVDSGTRGTETGLPSRKMPIKKIGNKWQVLDSVSKWAKEHTKNEWELAKSIQKFGTKAHPFIHNFEDVINNNIQMIQDALGIEIEDKIYKALRDDNYTR